MLMLALMVSVWLAEPVVTGVVKDSSGATVSGASVTIQTSSGAGQQTVTGPDGRFSIDAAPSGPATLVVRAGGFAETRQALGDARDVEIVLAPAGVFESVTVTPTRSEQRLGDVPASVAILDAATIRESPAVVADDVLRQVPTFSLFRRASSLAAHPTAQGVSLRGIGPSGVSRTLVLIDDVPFNDPFGGWVYWTRVPLESVDRIEIVEGASSSLYGNYGMGGVINIVSGRATRQTIEFKPQFGNRDTRKADLFGSHVWGRLGVSANANWLDTDGFPTVLQAERGVVDTNARVTFRNFDAKADYTVNSRLSVFFRAGHFREERDNAKVTTFAPTVAEGNDTRWTTTATGARILLPDSSTVQARVFTDDANFHSNFLAVPNLATRAIGRLSLDQRVPTNSVGGLVQWSRAFGMRNIVSAGTDWRWVDGDSNEDGFDTATGQNITLRRVAGGTQKSVGAYVQDILSPVEKLVVTMSARVDRWRSYDGHNRETSLPAGTPAAGNRPTLPERDDTVASPRLAARYHVNDRVSAWSSLSWGFRAPTLNELYRQFRQGTRLVLANNDLGPERLLGGEMGVNLVPARNLGVRATWFDNRIENPVSTVTLTTTPALITQQRRNLGRTRVTGFQTDADYRIGDAWRVTGGYLFNQAKFKDAAGNTALVGNCQGIAGASCFLQQVPEHRGSFQIAYTNPRYVNVAFGLQYIGLQYDDDQNIQGVTVNGCAVQATSCANPGLPGYSVLDLTVSRALNRNFEVFFGVQNLADEQYFVQTNPSTIGSPRLVNGGVRVRFSGR